MAIIKVKNHWGGSSAPWHEAGTWVLGCRDNQNFVSVDISSTDGGKSFTGTMVYMNEGPIGVKAIQIAGNNYSVKNQWAEILRLGMMLVNLLLELEMVKMQLN